MWNKWLATVVMAILPAVCQCDSEGMVTVEVKSSNYMDCSLAKSKSGDKTCH